MSYDREKLRLELEADEGKLGRPYRDTLGNLTIGVGWNLDAHPLPDKVIDLLTECGIEQAEQTLDALIPTWKTLADDKQRVLLNMAYNLGPLGLAQFRRFRAAIAEEDLKRAAAELEASLANKQTKGRYGRFAERLRA